MTAFDIFFIHEYSSIFVKIWFPWECDLTVNGCPGHAVVPHREARTQCDVQTPFSNCNGLQGSTWICDEYQEIGKLLISSSFAIILLRPPDTLYRTISLPSQTLLRRLCFDHCVFIYLFLVEKTSLLVGPVMYLYIYLFIYLCMYLFVRKTLLLD